MSNKEPFIQHITNGFSFKGVFITTSAAMLDGEPLAGAQVKTAAKTRNRRDLIAVATGTGKTKTLQALAKQLSQKEVPVLLMDIKEGLSGIATASEGHEKINERHDKIAIPFKKHK